MGDFCVLGYEMHFFLFLPSAMSYKLWRRIRNGLDFVCLDYLSHLKFLGASWVTWSKDHSENPGILGASIQNVVTWMTCHLGFLHQTYRNGCPVFSTANIHLLLLGPIMSQTPFMSSTLILSFYPFLSLINSHFSRGIFSKISMCIRVSCNLSFIWLLMS